MRALLTPEVAPRMGIVLFRPGSELMPLFMQGRVLLEPEPERYSSFASGAVPAASQPLADDPTVRAVFRNEAVIRRAGGVECLESWLLREKGCQWPHSDWHSENMTTMRHAPGAIRLCWHCDNQLRDQFTERLESMATDNCARWVLSVVRRDLGFDDSHVVTMPELCWWLVRNDLADALPESAARKALRLPKPVVPSVTRESDLVPSVPATSIIQDKAKKVLALKVDPESPESFMLRPKRRRWVNEKYTRWVKTQPCACCGKPADDPHHLIGHGQGGMGTKAHDLFVLPLCRKHHDELHADIWHVRTLTLDGLVGLNPIAYAREAISLAAATEEHGARLFSNGAVTSGVLRTEQTLSDQAYERLKKDFEERHTGLGNAHRPMILEMGLDWKSMALNAEEIGRAHV